MVGPSEPIPDSWKLPVLEILKRRRTNQEIFWDPNPRIDWSVFGMPMDAYDCIVNALQPQGVCGKIHYHLSDQTKTTYDFLFQYPPAPFQHYGKITLMRNSVSIRILSAHKAEKENL